MKKKSSNGREEIYSTIAAVFVVITVIGFMSRQFSGWDKFAELPYAFLGTFLSAVIFIPAVIILFLYLRRGYKREWKFALIPIRAKISRRWQHFVRRHRKAKFHGELPLYRLIGRRRI